MKQSALFIYNGYDIHTDSSMTVEGKPYQAKRSWRERLFTWPWRPFKSTYIVVPQVPSSEALIMGRKMIMHPETAEQLRQHCLLKEADRHITGKPLVIE